MRTTNNPWRSEGAAWQFVRLNAALAVGCIAAGLSARSAGLASDPAFGPPVSVPREIAKATALKARNLIDQTEEEARAKSRGCTDCHKNIEEMHASPHVVLGCTDCHGGNPTPGLLKQELAHV